MIPILARSRHLQTRFSASLKTLRFKSDPDKWVTMELPIIMKKAMGLVGFEPTTIWL